MRGLEGHNLHEFIQNGFLRLVDSGRHAHRVAIFDPAGRIVQIVSQSDIVRYLTDLCYWHISSGWYRFLAKNPRLLAEKADKTLNELGIDESLRAVL